MTAKQDKHRGVDGGNALQHRSNTGGVRLVAASLRVLGRVATYPLRVRVPGRSGRSMTARPAAIYYFESATR
jgi:hypothetical protein